MAKSRYSVICHQPDLPPRSPSLQPEDVWDALCSDRPYRQSWPEEKVLAYIREQAGTHFDPKAVELFLRVISEKTEEHH